jgi:hypothetical protein
MALRSLVRTRKSAVLRGHVFEKDVPYSPKNRLEDMFDFSSDGIVSSTKGRGKLHGESFEALGRMMSLIP